MQIANFKNRTVHKTKRYKEIILSLNLDAALDLKVSEFIILLNKEMKEQIDIKGLKEYDGDVLFKIYTDLPRIDLQDMRDVIMRSLSDALIESREFKHGEEILGIVTAPDFLQLEITITNLMDLINYNLIQESFDVEFFDNKKYSYRPLISRKAR